MSRRIKEGYNNVALLSGGVNEFLIGGFDPFNPLFNMVVTIHSPILPSVDSNIIVKPKPELTINDILALMPEFKELVYENEDIGVIFDFFFQFAYEVVDFEVINESIRLFKLLVAYHVGHHTEMHLKSFKDKFNNISANNEIDTNKEIHLEEITKLIYKGEIDEYMTTWYGRQFVKMYQPFLEKTIKGGYNRYGKY